MFNKSWFSGFVVGCAAVGTVALWYRSQLRAMKQAEANAASFYGEIIK